MRPPTRRLLPRVLLLAAPIVLAGGYLWQRAGVASTEIVRDTVVVQRETLDRTVSATGVLRPMVGAEINVGSRISGIVRSLPVEVGDPVLRGDLLAVIDPTELEAQLARAAADLALARAERALAEGAHRRAAALSADGIVSALDLESATRDLEVARAQVASQEARLATARITLGYTEIRAPIGGVIADVDTREGETVAASLAAPTFVTIVDLDRIEVQAYVDETDIGRIALDQEATFTVDTYPEAEFRARVVAVNPRAQLQSGVVNYIVRLTFHRREDAVLRPEMTTHIRFHVERRAGVLTLPRGAIRRDDGRNLVTVRRGEGWADQEVEIGWRTDRRAEILAGLDEGEIVQLNQE